MLHRRTGRGRRPRFHRPSDRLRPGIHPTAMVESERIGPGTRIWAFTHIMGEVIVGSDCNIGEGCFLEAGVVVGDRVTIKNGNHLWKGIVLEDDVFVGPGVQFTNDRYPRSPRSPFAGNRYSDEEWLLSTTVRRGASLGAGAVLLPGISIGRYGLVGAGAVVTRDVPDHGLVTGNPARLRGWVCYCGQPLSMAGELARCDKCGVVFRAPRGGHLDGFPHLEPSWIGIDGVLEADAPGGPPRRISRTG